ncbi:MAG: DUF881 domain-containing protein [Clostridium sp.]
MKGKSYNFVIFLAFILLGLLIAFNYNFEGIQTTLNMNAKEYQDAIEERNKLYKEISKLENLNDETAKKINSYDTHGKNDEKILEDMKRQLEDYSLLTGMSEVNGPGLVITIKDGDIDPTLDSEFTQWRKLFHDSDMIKVLNDFRKAGAEAIAINNLRFLPTTGVNCAWSFIKVDDSLEYAPFKFSIIGDPEVMKAALLEDGSHISSLILRDLNVHIEVKEEIILPATESKINADFLSPYREK